MPNKKPIETEALEGRNMKNGIIAIGTSFVITILTFKDYTTEAMALGIIISILLLMQRVH